MNFLNSFLRFFFKLFFGSRHSAPITPYNTESPASSTSDHPDSLLLENPPDGLQSSALSISDNPDSPAPNTSDHPDSPMLENPPNGLQSSALRNLPPEIVLHIASFLLPASAGAFSLCSRSTKLILGGKYLTALGARWNRSAEYYDFLMLLERDLPDCVLCRYCKELHAIRDAKFFGRGYVHRYASDKPRSCPRCITESRRVNSFYCIHSEFSYAIFQMMMKLRRQGRNYSELIKLMSPTSFSSYIRDESFRKQHIGRIRIVDGRLLLRKQEAYLMPPTQSLSLPRLPRCGFTICHHAGWVLPDYPGSFGDAFRRRIARWEDNLVELNQCRRCLVEFRFDSRRLGENGIIMMLTTWLDLGDGESSALLRYTAGDLGQFSGRPRELDRFQEGFTICKLFEQQEHPDVFSLLTLDEWKELFKYSPGLWPGDDYFVTS
ncbi:hypothetical protein BP6252_12772 [Coleophoma cylindrospora]|uniref:F-box domain-containing protein n=1 Tax=Coleophoma cylindrospora TaxID=1849047 RepID=A0A3D8QCV1_9HELO|nr:hypothetical protein BP6252_12772 [Coleophoma cylindrospora]